MSVIRKTKSVNTILSFFTKDHKAISVVDLVERLSQEMNKTTVYRVLERLENEGEIHSFTGAKGLKWYAKGHYCKTDYHEDVHPHFQCDDCGKVECLEINIPIPKLSNHNVITADVMLTGQCSDCMD
ncbi:MAG: transcriptional repressor [Bacteroidota bacterium]